MDKPKKTDKTHKRWTPKELALLESFGDTPVPRIAHLFPGRSEKAIWAQRHLLKIYSHEERGKHADPRRPLTAETAYHVRVDYAAKRKRGYTHEEALDWLREAHRRDLDILLDLLTNPEHDEAVRRHIQTIREEPDTNGDGDIIY